MDNLQEFLPQQSGPISLSEFLPAGETSSARYPLASAQQRAALSVVYSYDPSQASQNYQLLMNAYSLGDTAMFDSAVENVSKNSQKMDMKSVISILSDPNIPVEQKQGAISSIKNSQFLSDSNSVLMADSLARAAPNESFDEERARLSLAESIRRVYDSRVQVQGIVNAHAASLRGVDMKTVGEFLEIGIVPFATGVASSKLAGKRAEREGTERSLWQRVKDFALAGNVYEEQSKRFANMPPQERVRFAQGLAEDLSKDDGLIFSTDNHFAQYMQANNIMGEGGYATWEKWLDNTAGLLDVIGLGFTIRGLKGIGKAARRAPDAPTLPDLPPGSQTAPEAIVGPDRAVRRKQRQAIATERVQDELNFDPSLPTPDSPPTGPIPGILSERTSGVPYLLGGSGVSVADEPVKQVAALFRRIEVNNTVIPDNPASVAKTVQQTNPEDAAALHATVVKSDNLEVPQALYGTDRVSAIASDVMPQADTGTGAVRTRIADIQSKLMSTLDFPKEILTLMFNTGAKYFTPAEKAYVRGNVVNHFQKAEGLSMNDAMSSFAVDGGRIKISAVMGTPNGGFSNAEEALEQVKFALRDYNLDGSELQLLVKDGIDHVPTTFEAARGKEGNYLVRVNTFHDIDPTDLLTVEGKSVLEGATVSWNFFDRFSTLMSNSKGTLSRWIANPGSMLDPVYVGAASNVADQAARFDKFMLDLATDFADKVKRLPAAHKMSKDARQQKLFEYIKEANYNGIALDQTDLLARGFTTQEIDALKAWKRYWDGQYYLENYDVIKSLNSNGFRMFQNATTELYAKPISKNRTLGGDVNAQGNNVVGGTLIFNPAANDATILTKVEIDDLYAKGGTLARLRRPVDINGNSVEYMLVRNTPTEYFRKFRPNDMVLNYRHGYYQLQYTAPKFVDKIDAKGKRTTVAVAGDIAEANNFAKRMHSTTGDVYEVRSDVNALRRESNEWWDLNSASGRIAQRFRGKLLEDAAGLNHLGDGSYIMNPVESAIRAAKSIAGRTVSRPMLEAAKARAINQYAKYFPPNEIGGHRWPRSLEEIGGKGKFTDSELADARTTWEYINYLENGYINSADDTYKAFLNALADGLGSVGASKLERGTRLFADETGGPVSFVKGTVFMAYLGTNPLRQLIVQPHQMVRTWAYNPIGWVSGAIPKLMADYTQAIMGIGKLSPEAKAFKEFIDSSGFMAAVDKQNLVRGVLTDIADTSNPVLRKAKEGLAIPRKMGFDAGEMANMLGHAAAVYEKYKRAGKNLADKSVRDDAYSEIRGISYGMNFADDMPYNQTAPAIILQFMQVPHKALLQMTDRRIPFKSRVSMAVGDVLLWGGPALLISEIYGDILPDDPEMRDIVSWGLESYLLNHMFSYVTGEEQRVDYSSIAPYDISGWRTVFEAVVTGGVEQVILASPAANLLFKDGSRAQQTLVAMSRFFGVADDSELKPVDLRTMLHEAAKFSSGYNNAVKAAMLLKLRQRLNDSGQVLEEDVTTVEAWHQLFGFGGMDTATLYKLSQEFYKSPEKFRDEMKKIARDTARYYSQQMELPSSDPKVFTQITSYLMSVVRETPEAAEIFNQELRKILSDKESQVLFQALKALEVPGGVSADQIRRLPIEQQETLMQYMKDLEDARARIREQK